MSTTLQQLLNLNAETAKKLSAQGCTTIYQLVQLAGTKLSRKDFAAKLGIGEGFLYDLAKKADFLRVNGIELWMADILISLGMRSIYDLAQAEPDKLFKAISQYLTENPNPEIIQPSEEAVQGWQIQAGMLRGVLTPDSQEKTPDFVPIVVDSPLIETPDEFFADMVDIVVNLGKGIAVAQQELDTTAIETQKQINSDPELRYAGLAATWYSIPEATFNLKMNYAVAQESTSEGKPAGKRIMLSPMNARYQNYFKINEAMQSDLSLKFIAVPPHSRFTEIIYVPLLIGKTLHEAKELLATVGLVAGNVTQLEGEPSLGDTEIKEQSLSPGAEARFNDAVHLTVLKKEGFILG